MQQVRDRQEGARGLEQRRAPLSHHEELGERVDGHELDAGLLEDALAAELRRQPLHRAVRAPVPVVHRVPQQLPRGVQQPEVHRPGVHPQRGGLPLQPLLDAPLHLRPQRQDVPVQRPADLDRTVREAVELLQSQAARAASTAITRPDSAPRSTANTVVVSALAMLRLVPSGVTAAGGGHAALARHPLGVVVLAVGTDGVLGHAELGAHLPQQRAHVGLEGVQQHPVRAQHVTRRLRFAQRVVVDRQRLGVRHLTVHDALDHRFDLRLDVVALVDHVGDVRRAIARLHDLHEDIEELERVLASDDEVVVGVLAGVEVEAAELPLAQQERHDVRDVGALGMVAGVDEHLCTLPELRAIT